MVCWTFSSAFPQSITNQVPLLTLSFNKMGERGMLPCICCLHESILNRYHSKVSVHSFQIDIIDHSVFSNGKNRYTYYWWAKAKINTHLCNSCHPLILWNAIISWTNRIFIAENLPGNLLEEHLWVELFSIYSINEDYGVVEHNDGNRRFCLYM